MTKDNQLFGIGNALMDSVLEVTDAQLDSLGLQKGSMTLIDEDRLAALEGYADGRWVQQQCGGSAANTIIGASQLGAGCFYSCRLGTDDVGTQYLTDLTTQGVETAKTQALFSQGRTGRCVVLVTPDAERTMATYLGVSAHFSQDDIDFEALSRSEYLYIEGYLVTSPDSKEAALAAKAHAEAHGVRTCFTFSDAFLVAQFREAIEAFLSPSLDVLFCNLEEALSYTGTKTLAEAADSLCSVAHSFAITLGDKGVYVYDGSQGYRVPSFPVQALDTVGAGDMFAGAFLGSLVQGRSFKESGLIGSKAASMVVSQYGPRLSDSDFVSIKSDFLLVK